MTAILRHALGDIAPVAGTYVLVGHYGEATNLFAWCDKGERLPTEVAVDDSIGPCWWVEESEANQQARVA